jgi:hypothetical protein
MYLAYLLFNGRAGAAGGKDKQLNLVKSEIVKSE